MELPNQTHSLDCRRHGLLLCLLLAGTLLLSWLPTVPAATPDSSDLDAAAIASAHSLATQAGHDILRQGGNAFDAAVAVAAVLAVVEPYSSGLGGGGFWLLIPAGSNPIALDSRERAPLQASTDMYLDSSGNVIEGLSINGALAAGIPGIPAAFDYLANKLGILPLSRSLLPAIHLARQGFSVDARYIRLAKWRQPVLATNLASRQIFLADGEVPALGDTIQQEQLAKTLMMIAERGGQAFYQGTFAQTLVGEVVRAGGIWQIEDLRQYEAVARKPLRFWYKGAEILTFPPPSSGGVALAQMFGMLKSFDLHNLSPTQKYHVLIEVMRRAYRDRTIYLGDPDYTSIPLTRLLSAEYLKTLSSQISLDAASVSDAASLPNGIANGRHTTHFSIIDRHKNIVAATLSINYPFGSGFTAASSGVLLNDEMDDFSIKSGHPNVYGLVGSTANAIVGSKRMLSSMSPTVVDDGQKIAILGTPGGSRIITMVMLAIKAFVDGENAKSVVTLPRFHHQYLPDAVTMEPRAIPAHTVDDLVHLGHTIDRLQHRYGNMQAVIWDYGNGTLQAASDPRGIGSAIIK